MQAEKAPTKRGEQYARTRERILDAAVESLINDGYSGATTLRIQELAKISRGGLLHQFPSRDELLVAAVNHVATARIAAMDTERSWPENPSERIDAAVEAMWSTYAQPYFWASVELWLAARHNPAIAQILWPLERRLGTRIRAVTAGFFGGELAAAPGFDELRELLNTSMRGVAMSYAVAGERNPADDPHVALWKRRAHQALRPATPAPDAGSAL